jgi:hypothetical protein
MSLDIERIAITLQGVSPDTGGRVADLLAGVLTRRLAALDRHAIRADIEQADIGTIDAPAGIDAQALTELIAGRLIDWLEREQRSTSPDHTTEGGH